MIDRQVVRIPFAKIVIVLAIAFGIGLGLCGIDVAFLDKFRSPGDEFGPNTLVGGIGAIAMALSALGLVLTVAAWVISALVSAFNPQDSEPQRLLEDKDDEDKKS